MHRALIVVLLCHAAVNIIADKCRTPVGEMAQCISLYNCSLLLDALRTLEPKSVEFVQRSQCSHGSPRPLVCCGSSIKEIPNWNRETPVTQPPTNPKLKLLPDRRYCGYQHFDDYFHVENDRISSIDEFPWMAVLIYERNGKPYFHGCVGSLISKKYVLTAAHCVKMFFANLVTVRLGEHNIEKDEDCLKTGQFYECADPVENFGVEEVIAHPKWNDRTKENDIGLIRLNKTVTYTDFIRPICLPFPGTTLAKVGDNLSLSGWGRNSSVENESNVKKKISAQLRSLEECLKAFNNTSVVLTDNQTCIKEMNSPDRCQSDSGSPVMFSHRKQWHQEGTVSFAWACGSQFPSVNVKVTNYLEWILENIRE